MPYSPEEDRRIMRMWLVPPTCTQQEIAEELGKSTSSVSRRVKKLGLRGEKGNVKLYADLTGEDMEPLLKPVQVQVDRSGEVGRQPSSYTSLHFSDTQIPFQDPAAVDVMLQIAGDADIDEVYAMGDIVDFWQISDFRPPDERRFDPDELELQSSIEQAASLLGRIEQATQPRRMVFMEGNHEERWTRLLRDMMKNHRTRHLLRMPKLNHALSLDYLLGLSDRGWEYYNYKHDQPLNLHDRLLLLHGYKTNKYVARSMLDEFGMSVLYGHDHKIQQWTRTDMNGQIAAFGIGCLCQRAQHYSNHGAGYGHQGFALVDWTETDEGWYFNVDQIRIHEGQTIWRGTHYRA